MRRGDVKLPGRPRTKRPFSFKCEFCGKRVIRPYPNPNRPARFCSRQCNLAFERGKRRKLPGAQVVADLYVKKRMTLEAIAAKYGTTHKTVERCLERLGVPRRKHTVPQFCTEPGCPNRVQKIKHATNGAEYGTLCGLHRRLHRERLAQDYRETEKGLKVIRKYKKKLAESLERPSDKRLDSGDVERLFDLEGVAGVELVPRNSGCKPFKQSGARFATVRAPIP